MMTVISLPRSSLTDAVIGGFDAAAQQYTTIINKYISKKYTPTTALGAVVGAKPAWYGWKVYDHELTHHVSSVIRQYFQGTGLSVSDTASIFLEFLNRSFKEALARHTSRGGGHASARALVPQQGS